jgi:imidazolonepropionase-like amidohydrolase
VDIEALLPVLEKRVPLAVVAQREADIRQALAVGKDFGISIVIVGGAEAWRAAGLLASRHVPVVLDPLDELPVSYDTLGARRDNAKILAEAGVTIGFMVSAQGIYLSYDVGTALREGAGIAAANGLPYAQALRAITHDAARIWGDPVPAGTLVPGGAADLVVWDGDPLEAASAPVAILLNGNEISLRTRQTLLRDRYRPASIERPSAPTGR